MTDKPTFTDFGVDDEFVRALAARDIVHPFPIQELTLPLAIKGHDIIGQARTGTGKTLAFGLPLLQRIDTSRDVTQALVIVPTRELCLQVADDLTIGADRGITSIAVYGGVGYEEQIEALTGGVHVVVGTPGRTLDHLGRGNLDVSNVHVVVLDEADEMLDMGFLPDVERLLVDVPEERQTLLFSATMPTAIVKLARRFMDKPTFMRADETLHETAPTVDQHFFLVHRMDKPRILARLLQMPGRGGAFVFTRTKAMADRLVRELDDLHVSAIAVHGDLRQATREKNLDRFRDGKADVLVATEVAARGLDVSNVTHVVNYDCPDDEKMYLHRIGRTARAGESGVAVTFAEFNEVDRVNVIRKRVAADEDVREIFSTSDELTELFDLPDQTPWDHLASSGSGGNGDGGSRGRGGSGSRGGSSQRRSSGRSRSSRRGADGTRRDTSRARTRSSSGDTGGSDSSRGRAGKDDLSKDGAPAGRSRTRSRTRARSRSTKKVDERAAAREVGDDAGHDTRAERAQGGDRGQSTRRRAKADASSGQDDADRTRARSSRGTDDDTPRRGGARSRARRSRGGSSRRSSDGDDRGRGKGGGRNDGGDRRGSGGDDGRARRDEGTGRKHGRSGRGREQRSGRGRDGADTTTRGEDARGTGRPRPRRRVAVDHLP